MPEHRGWCIWDGVRAIYRYVFRTAEDAETYRSVNDMDGGEVRPVLSEAPYNWRPSAGSIVDIEVADQLYDVFPTRAFRAGDRRAFLQPS